MRKIIDNMFINLRIFHININNFYKIPKNKPNIIISYF